MSKLYITDLDGTLLNRNARITYYAKDELNRLISKGCQITVASARSITSIKKILDGLNLSLPVIEINGSFITDYQTGKHLHSEPISTDVCIDIHRIIDEHNALPFIFCCENGIDRLYYEGVANDGMHWFLNDKTEDHRGKSKQQPIDDSVFENDTVGFVVIGQDTDIDAIYADIYAEYNGFVDCYLFANPYCPQWKWLTVHSNRARKSNAVLELAKHLGKDLSDVVVFGDNENDLSMIKLNEMDLFSVAVENAIEPVKKAASLVCRSNEEDGVVRYISADFGL